VRDDDATLIHARHMEVLSQEVRDALSLERFTAYQEIA